MAKFDLRSPVVVFAALALSRAAAAAPIPVTPGDVSLIREGHAYVFRSDASLPLYTFDKDGPGRSHCTGACAAAWPPLLASAGARPVGEWTLVTRPEGRLQWAWRGRPVYTHAADGPEKATGEGAEGLWRLMPRIAD